MPSKDTNILSVRVPNQVIARIRGRLNKKGLTLNRWLNKAILDALRSHKKLK